MIKVGNVWYPLSQRIQAGDAMFWIIRARVTANRKILRYGLKR
jgi:hypothetical protein